ncbi:MAG: S49 family peptidase [Burkholderiaceae bacterium]|nr:S49 family peptidase [Burkholderiaceae bacterium]
MDPIEREPPAAQPAGATVAAAAGAAPARAEGGDATAAALATAVRALVADRRSERHWWIFFRLAWFALFAIVAWALLSRAAPVVAPATPHTALVEVRGEIAADTEASADRLVSALEDAFADGGAKAVVLRFNSPGGSPVQSGIVYDEIVRLKAAHAKKVYAVVEDVCASGAYYIAAAADAIYVDKASLVGSVGVLMDGFGFVGLMDKLGVERRLLTAGEHKGLLDPFSPRDPADTAHAQALIDQIHHQFIDAVKRGRGERLKETGETFSGLVWNGEEAVRIGLADGVGSLTYVAREVVGAEEIVDYTAHENLAERLARRFGAAVGESAVRALRGLAPLR